MYLSWGCVQHGELEAWDGGGGAGGGGEGGGGGGGGGGGRRRRRRRGGRDMPRQNVKMFYGMTLETTYNNSYMRLCKTYSAVKPLCRSSTEIVIINNSSLNNTRGP